VHAVTIPEWAERVFRLTIAPTFTSMAPFEMVAFGAGKRGTFRATWRREPGRALPPATITTPETEFQPGGWRELNHLFDRAAFWGMPTVPSFDTRLTRDGVCYDLSVTERDHEHTVVRHAEMERELARVVNYLVDASGVFEPGTREHRLYRHVWQLLEGDAGS
jgi:hypothetical protein